jgi:hypothetical protein
MLSGLVSRYSRKPTNSSASEAIGSGYLPRPTGTTCTGVVSLPCKWQKRFNFSDITVAHRIDTPVDEKIVSELLRKFPDFGRAYKENGIEIADPAAVY